jgi:type II secretory pathway component PulF
MATFEYSALTSGGRLMKGTIEAGSPEEAGTSLEAMGLRVNLLEKARASRPHTAIGRNEFVLFNQQLASIAKAGIPLERGLRELSQDMASKSMRQLIDAIADDLEKGTSVQDAFEKRQKQFPPLYGRILKVGVETGRLSEMLASLNRHLELVGHTRRIVFEAVCYPAVIFVLSMVIITLVSRFIIPQFAAVLGEMAGGRLNPMTQFVFGLAGHIIPFWIGVAMIVGLLVFVFSALSSTPAGRRFREGFFLRLPVLGKLYRNSLLSRMAEAMAVLIEAGSDVPECLRLGAASAGSELLTLDSEYVAGRLERGENILQAGQGAVMLPRLFLYSVQLGGQRNELQENLHSLADMYADQARSAQSRLQSLLLPAMVVVVGGVIAMNVLAIFLPMVQVIASLGG